jgi:fatty acid desaturase
LVKKLLSFLGWVPVILVGMLGAYIVFHMWQLTEIGHRHSPRKQAVTNGQASATGAQQGLPTANAKGSPEGTAMSGGK